MVSIIRNKNSAIVDLGSAPGSWSQILSLYSSPYSKIIAIDLLPMLPLDRVQFVNLDFTTENAIFVLNSILKQSNNNHIVKLVVSDLCANLTGNALIDVHNNLNLWNCALKFSILHLSEKGHFIIKYFESVEAQLFRKKLESQFDRVIVFKPSSSRTESSEKYFICLYRKKN